MCAPTIIFLILSSYVKILSSQCLCTTVNSHVLSNPSFETGDATEWTITPHPAPIYPMEVLPAPNYPIKCFATNPTDGNYSIGNGWDGYSNGSSILTSDIVSVPTCDGGVGTLLMFDYGYQFENYYGTNDRIFYVHIIACDAVSVLQTEIIQVAPGGTLSDRGVVASVNITAYVDQNIYIRFEWFSPADSIGPFCTGYAELDNIRFGNAVNTTNVCTMLNCNTKSPTQSTGATDSPDSDSDSDESTGTSGSDDNGAISSESSEGTSEESIDDANMGGYTNRNGHEGVEGQAKGNGGRGSGGKRIITNGGGGTVLNLFVIIFVIIGILITIGIATWCYYNKYKHRHYIEHKTFDFEANEEINRDVKLNEMAVMVDEGNDDTQVNISAAIAPM